MIAVFTMSYVVPIAALAASPGYIMNSATIQVTGARQLSVSGSASASPFVGQVTDQFVTIIWGDGSQDGNMQLAGAGKDARFTTSCTDKNNNPIFCTLKDSANLQTLWTPISHAYALSYAGQSVTILIKIHHQSFQGAEGNDSEFSAIVTIPPAALKVIVNTTGGTLTSPDFTVNITGVNASPSSFPGSESGTVVSLDEGAYSVTESSDPQYATVLSTDCVDNVASGDSKTCTITNTFITNHEPVLDPIVVAPVLEETAATFTAHAADADDDTINYSLSGEPAGASIDPSTGEFTWTPTETQGPLDYTFIVYADDKNGGVDSQSVTITVNEFNEAPTAYDILNESTHKETPVEIVLLATDPDFPPNTLTYNIVNSPSHGTLSDIDTNHKVIYTPEAGFENQTDTFTYKVTDDGSPAKDSSVATVSISVTNDAPTIIRIENPEGGQISDPVITTELVPLSLTGIASDPDSDQLTFYLGTHPDGSAITAGGVFNWTPSESQGMNPPTAYPVEIIVSDETKTDSLTFNIEVLEANEPPVARDQETSTVEDNATGLIQLSATDPDLPANTITYSISTEQRPANGILERVGNTVQYIPKHNFFGTDSFSYTASDGNGGTDEGTVTVTVEPRNDPPVIETEILSLSLTSGEPFVMPDYSATDPEDGDLTDEVVVGGDEINSSTPPGTYYITLDVKDADPLLPLPANTVTITVTVNSAPPPDADNDGIIDSDDNCVNTPNTDQADADGDGIGDVCDETPNGDGDGGGDDTPPLPQTPACSNNADDDYDGLTDMSDPGCIDTSDTDETNTTQSPPPEEESTPPPPSGGGGGGGGGGGNGSPFLISQNPTPPAIGQVLGASVSNAAPIQGQVLGAYEEVCSDPLLKTYIRLGAGNDSEEVKRLQNFLNKYVKSDLPITGYYGPLTFAAVKQFQVQEALEVLVPWIKQTGSIDSNGTGYVYKTTKRRVNMIHCSALDIPMPILP